MKTLGLFAALIMGVLLFDIYVGVAYGFADAYYHHYLVFNCKGRILPFYHFFKSIPNFSVWVIGSGLVCFILLKEKVLWEALIFVFLNRGNPDADSIETEDELRAQGYTTAQIKREIRAQKSAQRQHDWLRNSNIRTVRTLKRL